LLHGLIKHFPVKPLTETTGKPGKGSWTPSWQGTEMPGRRYAGFSSTGETAGGQN